MTGLSIIWGKLSTMIFDSSKVWEGRCFQPMCFSSSGWGTYIYQDPKLNSLGDDNSSHPPNNDRNAGILTYQKWVNHLRTLLLQQQSLIWVSIIPRKAIRKNKSWDFGSTPNLEFLHPSATSRRTKWEPRMKFNGASKGTKARSSVCQGQIPMGRWDRYIYHWHGWCFWYGKCSRQIWPYMTHGWLRFVMVNL